MTLPKRLLDQAIYVIDRENDSALMYGRVLGQSEEWTAIQTYLTSGEADSIRLIRWDDVIEIKLTSPRLDALRQLAPPNWERRELDPAKLLDGWIRDGVLVSLTIDEEETYQAVIEKKNEDWLWWTSYTRQGLPRGSRITRIEEIEAIEAFGVLERRVERNAGVASIQRSMERS